GAVATPRRLVLEEQRRRAALVMGGRPSFPPPPVLGRSTLGAVDMPIGCALIFFDVSGCAIPRAAQPQDTYQRHVFKSWARQRFRILCASRTGSGELGSPAPYATASPDARLACARADALCDQKTTPG